MTVPAPVPGRSEQATAESEMKVTSLQGASSTYTCGVSGSGFKILGFGLRVQSFGLRVKGLRFRV